MAGGGLRSQTTGKAETVRGRQGAASDVCAEDCTLKAHAPPVLLYIAAARADPRSNPSAR